MWAQMQRFFLLRCYFPGVNSRKTTSRLHTETYRSYYHNCLDILLWQFSPNRLVQIASARLPEHFGEFSLGGLDRLLNQVTCSRV